MKREHIYQKKAKKKKDKNGIKTGLITQLIAITPFMEKKIANSRTIFGNEQTISKKEIDSKLEEKKTFLNIKSVNYQDDDSQKVSKKINEGFIWNKLSSKYSKNKKDFNIIANELAKNYLSKDQKLIDVDFTIDSKEK